MIRSNENWNKNGDIPPPSPPSGFKSSVPKFPTTTVRNLSLTLCQKERDSGGTARGLKSENHLSKVRLLIFFFFSFSPLSYFKKKIGLSSPFILKQQQLRTQDLRVYAQSGKKTGVHISCCWCCCHIGVAACGSGREGGTLYPSFPSPLTHSSMGTPRLNFQTPCSNLHQ